MLRVGILLLSLLLPTQLYAAKSDAETITQWKISQAKFLISSEITPPDLHIDQWQDVSLPHHWQHEFAEQTGVVWYRLYFQLERLDKALWSVYLPKLSMNASIWLNGSLIGKSGQFEEPLSRNWNRPLIFAISATALQAGTNTIDVYVKAYRDNGGGLAPLYVGPEEELIGLYEWRKFFLNTIPMISFFMIIWLAMIAALLWSLNRQESMYGWFALACLWACLYLSNHFVRDIPVSRDLWEWAFHLSIDAFVASILLFVHRWTGVQRKWVERLMWGWIIVAYLLLLVFDYYKVSHMSLFHIGAVIGGAYIVWLMISCWLKRREKVFLFILATYAVNTALGIHDWYVVLYGSAYESIYLMPYAVSFQLIVIAVYLILRFAQLQQRAKRFTNELQQKVDETTARLNSEHEEVRGLEKKQLISDERERMMRDLHDGLGGQLVSALSQVNHYQTSEPTLKQTLSDALLDLRLVIDSLDEDNSDLTTMLGMLRMRLEPQLRSSGITLGWKLFGDPEVDGFSHETSLHLLRIVQEAITNAIRHARCSEIQMSIRADAGEVTVCIEDNGVGIGDTVVGRGTGNMRRRAEKIGAHLSIDSIEHGVKVQVRLLTPTKHPDVASPNTP